MAWFGNRRRTLDLLIEQIIQEGIQRRKDDHELAGKQREFELKKLEIEMEHLSEKREEDRKDRAEREAARNARRKAAETARAVYAARRGEPNTCKVCNDPSDPSLTARDMEWHYNGHREGPSLWAS